MAASRGLPPAPAAGGGAAAPALAGVQETLLVEGMLEHERYNGPVISRRLDKQQTNKRQKRYFQKNVFGLI